MLKAHDIVVALKYGTTACLQPDDIQDPGLKTGKPVASRWYAAQLKISQSEVVKSTARLISSRLIVKTAREIRADRVQSPYQLVTRNMAEFLVHGVRYCFPPEKKGVVRGIPTGWSCPLLKSEMVPPAIPMVWESGHGTVSGEGLIPLYAGMPFATERDEQLYRTLSLVEVLREGKPRELAVAKRLMEEIMEKINHAQLSSRA